MIGINMKGLNEFLTKETKGCGGSCGGNCGGSNEVVVKVKTNQERLPEYMTDMAAGADLYLPTTVMIMSGELVNIPTDYYCEIPEGYEMEIRPRGSTFKKGLLVHNGTVDADYRGNIFITVLNLNPSPVVVRKGERIAQAIFHKVARVVFERTNDLNETKRGDGHHASTGV